MRSHLQKLEGKKGVKVSSSCAIIEFDAPLIQGWIVPTMFQMLPLLSNAIVIIIIIIVIVTFVFTFSRPKNL